MTLNENNLPEIGAWLKKRRKEMKITTYMLDREHHVHVRTTNAIERGDSPQGYTIKALSRYCNAIGVKIELKDE